MQALLVLNAGSSSLKFGLFTDTPEPEPLAAGQIERIGAAPRLVLRGADGTDLTREDLAPDTAADHGGALTAALAATGQHFAGLRIAAVGHRIVHGGQEFANPVGLTPDILSALERLEPLAPLHQPHNLAGVRAAVAAFPQARQVGCFDTAFHRGQPFESDAYALPRSYYDRGIRRYGFHGLSYDYITGWLARNAPELHDGRVVVAHLGAGASTCAIMGGRAVGSSMGFSPLDGLAMGTRPGQLDPGVLLWLLDHEGLDSAALTDLLYRRSGLLGLSGLSADMRVLLDSDAPEAAQAIGYFCQRIRRSIAELAAVMQGIDAVVFTAGIGENSAPIRAEVCAGLAWLGLALDARANAADAPAADGPDGARRISTGASLVRALVIPTNEEIVIARATARL